MTNQQNIIVVGGGITGLTAVYRLQTLLPHANITLIEKTKHLGGKIATERVEGCIIEGGPDCFLSRKPRGIALAEELGVAERLNGRQPHNKRTYVMRHQELHRLPEGLTGMIPTDLDALAQSTLISSEGQKRVAQEKEIPPAPLNGDESVAQFVRRRMGDEAYENLIEPLMGGIYAGDAEQLSLAATFPQLRKIESNYGSLLGGLLERPAPPSDDSYAPFVSFPTGMSELVELLLAQISQATILTGVSVTKLEKEANGRYTLTLDNNQIQQADGVILATPAFVTAKLLQEIDPVVAQAHAEIPYGSSVTISMIYDKKDVRHDLAGYGYVIPRAEQTDVLACTWTSSKWAGRAPDDLVQLRVYAGRYGMADMTKEDDETLIALAQKELLETMDIDAEPKLTRVYRWVKGMPQYVMGHTDRVATIREEMTQHNGLEVAGAAYEGVGIPDCIREGENAAQAIAAYWHENTVQQA